MAGFHDAGLTCGSIDADWQTTSRSDSSRGQAWPPHAVVGAATGVGANHPIIAGRVISKLSDHTYDESVEKRCNVRTAQIS